MYSYVYIDLHYCFQQCEINLKETSLEKSAHAFSEKEKILHKKIEELEERLNVKEVEKVG